MSKSILLVEDDPDVRVALEAALSDEGFSVHAVENGRDALYALADMGGHALVLLDLMLPVLSGWEVVEWLKRIGSRSPIIVVSAAENAATVTGITAFVAKPLKLDVLLPLIHKHAA